ncbi:uncharacterized protein LOC110048163 [Orbicella faveolata]|uniref:uncharacterized protein LOC110048163 n=1 Tax=Orbicella faveolata TaxID=48498 RepID=UPI0009E39E15|nr:uncharacterized protein LOC110048163 [Orbicella faveolata]
MNQARQPASAQEEICEQNLSQETSFQLHKTLCELLNHLGLTCQEPMRYQVASPIQEQRNERSRGFNWECPGIAEYETVRGIRKQQKQLLQQEHHEGKGTSLRKLLLDLLRSLWRYLLFKSAGEENEQPNSARCSRFHHEWREFQQVSTANIN